MEKRPSRFEPKANERIRLFGEEYTVQPHPSISYLPFSSEGRRALVCQLRNRRGEYFAFKVFKKKYRNKMLASSAEHLYNLQAFEGMRAANRRVILPGDAILQQYNNVVYAMLMPWVFGATWFDILQRAAKDGFYLQKSDSIHLCHRFLTVMAGLEEAGMAHTDISSGNVALEIKALDVQLLDLEDLYLPGAVTPQHQNMGSRGYRHHTCETGKTCWCAEGDRYAAAVFAAEILILSNKELARKATEDGFFVDHCRTEEGDKRFKEAKDWMKDISPRFVHLFERAWYADTLIDCPKISNLRSAIGEVAVNTPRVANTTAAVPQDTPFVQWEPLHPRKTPRAGTSPVTWVQEGTVTPRPQAPLEKFLGAYPALKFLGAYPALKIGIGASILAFIILLIIYFA